MFGACLTQFELVIILPDEDEDPKFSDAYHLYVSTVL
jgi:hypothetical protein